jgi:hypothetical protein
MSDLPGRGDYEFWAPNGHPMDPRTDDEPSGKECWEEENRFVEMIGLSAMSEILEELRSGDPQTAANMLRKELDSSWRQIEIKEAA